MIFWSIMKNEPQQFNVEVDAEVPMPGRRNWNNSNVSVVGPVWAAYDQVQ